MAIQLQWLTLADIKAQLRIEPGNTLEDDLLKLYGRGAEDALLNACERTLDDIKSANNDEVPAGLHIAALMLATHLYEHRGPTTNVPVSAIPYTLDVYWKPYARLANPKYL